MGDVNSGEAVDGRRARRDRNRLAVLEAAIALFTEGVLEPGPEEVAERSGVSLRSVYRYFADPAELRRAATEVHLERVRAIARIPDVGDGSLAERIDAFATTRVRLHDAVAPALRAGRVAATRSPDYAERYAQGRRELRAQADRQFAPELRAMRPVERRAVRAAIDALVQLEGLDLLRVELAMSARQATDAVRVALSRLLA